MILIDTIAVLTMKINNFGVLYIVATPIGNLQDITFRAIDILRSVHSIAAEDTRHSMFLLTQYAIHTPVISLHEHNERERVSIMIDKLMKGESIALISDAGTPLISDPGYFLVREVRDQGIRVVPVPGPCAAIAALCASGLPTDKFIFAGFLANKSKKRKDSLIKFIYESATVIFYESPHRIVDLLADMQEVFGPERRVVIARELTKVFETIRSGILAELIDWVNHDENQQKGEIVVLLEGLKGQVTNDAMVEMRKMLSVLLEAVPLKQAVDIATKLSGQRKNEIYELALQLKQGDEF